MSKLDNDLLRNFATWPDHIQQSFLEMVSRQIAVEEQRTQAEHRTHLDEVVEDFDVLLNILADRIHGLTEEIVTTAETDHLAQAILRNETVRKIRRRQRQLANLEALLNHLLSDC